MSSASTPSRRRPAQPAPASRAFYMQQAETCLAAAARARDVAARGLYEEECRLWLMLARQREAIETVLQRLVDGPAEP